MGQSKVFIARYKLGARQWFTVYVDGLECSTPIESRLILRRSFLSFKILYNVWRRFAGYFLKSFECVRLTELKLHIHPTHSLIQSYSQHRTNPILIQHALYCHSVYKFDSTEAIELTRLFSTKSFSSISSTVYQHENIVISSV